MCDNREVLPRSYFIPGGSLSHRGKPFSAGGSTDTDVDQAEFNGKKACVKALRSHVQREVCSFTVYPLETTAVTTVTAAVLWGNYCMEEATAPKHRPFARNSRRDAVVRDRLRLDGTWYDN